MSIFKKNFLRHVRTDRSLIHTQLKKSSQQKLSLGCGGEQKVNLAKTWEELLQISLSK